MYRFLIILTFFCSNSCNIYNGTISNYNSRQKEIADSNIVLKENNQTIKTKSDDDELLQIINSNEARGIDSLVGIKKDRAMPILSKYNFTEVSEHHYPYIKQVLKIENFNKWSHPSTLYIFVDSSDRICKMNYFFNNEIPKEDAKNFEDSMSWALPIEKYPELEKGQIYEDDLPGRPRKHRFGGTSWSGVSWQGIFLHRLFWKNKMTLVKVIYSAALMPNSLYEPHNGETLQDDIYEPILGTQK